MNPDSKSISYELQNGLVPLLSCITYTVEELIQYKYIETVIKVIKITK